MLPRSVFALSVLLASLPAVAAIPVELPPGEDPAVWASALALGDFEVGPPGDGSWVQITVTPDQLWQVAIRDATGTISRDPVVPAETVEDREAIITLARMRLPAATKGADVPVRISDAPPLAPPVTPPVAPVAPPAVEVVVAPTEPPALWAEAGSGVGWRSDTSVGLDLRVAAGFRPADALRLAVGADLRPAGALAALGPERRAGSAAAWVLAGWTPAPVVTAGVIGGASVATFTQGGALVERVVSPLVGAHLGFAVPLAGPLALAPYAEGRLDLRSIDLRDGAEGAPDGYSPVEARAGIAIRIEP